MLPESMRRRALPILLAFLALALVWTWPLARHISSRIPHDPGYPMPGALALSEHLAGIGLFATPIQWFHANALSAYNVALILSFALSGFFTFFLVLRLVPPSSPAFTRHAAALCGALAYGFGPYRAGRLAHLQVLTSQWMPLALPAMDAHVEDGRRRWLLVFAVAWLLQALSNGYYLLFFPVLVACWLA